MRVVYLNPSGQLGGAEMALLDLMASVRKAEPKWTLHLILGADGPLATRAATIGVSVTVLRFPQLLARLGDAGTGGPAGARASRATLFRKLLRAGPAVVQYVHLLKRAICRIRPDLIHTNGFKMHVLGARAVPPKSIPVIWHVRDYVSLRPLMARLIRRHMSRCAAVVTNSRSVAEDVRTVCGADVKIYPVLDAIDLEKFSHDGEKLDLDLLSGLPSAEPGTLRVGLLATMARWKGQETFLSALASLPAGLKIRGYVIGGALYQTEGSQYSIDELRNRASELGLGSKVGFTGFVDNPASAMRALDIVVHASTQPEPFGLVIAEAMACGRALVVSNAGGAAEIISVGTNALGHAPGDVHGLADCITRLATESDLRKRLGEAGRITALRAFDRARLATDLIPIYQEALRAKA